MLKQDINFVDVDPGVPPQRPITDDAVEHAVQHHQHTYWQELFAQVPDVVAEDARIRIHIGGLGKSVETALGEQLNGQGHVLGLRLGLAEQLGVKVLEGRSGTLTPAPDILVVALGGAAVDDGFFFCGELARAHQLFA